MTKTAFLRELENALEGEVASAVIADTVRYYDRYITDAVNAGATEAEVIESLGSGNVIAKTVIASNQAEERRGRENRTSAYEDTARQQRGLHVDMTQDGSMDLKYGTFKLNSWYGKLLGCLLVVLVIALIFLVIAGLFSLLWTLLPVLLVGILVITLLRYFFG